MGLVSYNHIVVAVSDKHAISCLDDLRQDVLDWVRAGVAFAFRSRRPANKDSLVRALGPVDIHRSMYSLFDVGAIEVDLCAWVSVHKLCRKAEDVAQYRTHLYNLIDVEAGIGIECGEVYQIKDIALAGDIGPNCRLDTGRWERHVLLDVVSITTTLVQALKLGEKALVEAEQVVVRLDEWNNDSFFLGIIELPNAGVERKSS